MTVTTQTLIAPGANQTFVSKAGVSYTSNSNSLITGVAASDAPSLIIAGCKYDSYFLRTVGTFTANGTSAVTVADPLAAVTDLVVVSLNTVGGTVGALPHLSTLTPSSQYQFVGSASDTSTYNYQIFSLNQ